MANASLDDTEKELGDVSIPESFKYDYVNENLPDGVTFDGATLSLKSVTTLSLYFKGLPDYAVFSCTGKTVETTKNGNYIVARIRDIKASSLGDNFIVNFEGGSVTYNTMTYCYNVLHGSTEDTALQKVCRALFLYSQAAKEFYE